MNGTRWYILGTCSGTGTCSATGTCNWRSSSSSSSTTTITTTTIIFLFCLVVMDLPAAATGAMQRAKAWLPRLIVQALNKLHGLLAL